MIIALAAVLATLLAGFGFISLRKMREAEENNMAKNRFLATISHEMRTPMNSILGIAEIQLRDESLAPQVSTEELQAIFPLDVKNVLPVIENTLKNIDSATAKDLRLFSVNVHAIKSALANIGETVASKLAFILEKAGKEQDTGAIKAHARVLIDEIQSINARIESKRKTLDSVKNIDEDPIFLQEQLQIIYTACADYDERPINAAISALEKLSWRRETQVLIDKISEQMLYGDFEEVRKLAYTSEEVVI